ncbi:MAG TPA: hypothetical protein VLM38_02850, partial [Blastocatellia bacterium]|nr:hypothetical protein [Blastocatellia bacterium]
TRTSAELTLLYRGMIIAIAGAFEQFVRRVAEEAVVLINRSVQHYDALWARRRRSPTMRKTRWRR